MYIIIPHPYRQPFLAYISRWARPAFTLTLDGDTLHIDALPAHLAAAALAVSAFPCWEKEQLQRLAKQRYACFTAEERRLLVSLAVELVAHDLHRGVPASGPRRLSRVSGLIEQQLELGEFNFPGFCRFALAGHEDYLLYSLDLAADRLLANEEEAAYRELLRQVVAPRPDSVDLVLRFYPRGRCQVWLYGEGDPRQTEGGCFTGREDMLIANVLGAHPRRVVVSAEKWANPLILHELASVLGERLLHVELEETALTSATADDMIRQTLSL